MSCYRCDGTGQCVTRTTPYEFTYRGRTITKTYTFVAPCPQCERGQRIAVARAAKGIGAEAARRSAGESAA